MHSRSPEGEEVGAMCVHDCSRNKAMAFLSAFIEKMFTKILPCFFNLEDIF